ncbi:helix-loop-helix DNA-binding domain-containing protein [Colletotrichum higginsianum]|nr:helix-loop-helix DNA-binding domain-containing protein [Colletotrichum higginsianum]
MAFQIELRQARIRGGEMPMYRTKVDSEAAALESVDYWIQFDDDEEQKFGGSFEIDFSRRSNPTPNYRPRYFHPPT